MSKFFYLITLTIAMITLTACSTPAAAAMPLQTNQPASSNQPTTIQDAVLLEGWTALYNHQETIQMPDGRTLTGRNLAQFIIDNAIPVLWTPADDHQTSYSTIACGGDVCTYDDGHPGTDPIYITASIKTLEDGRMSQLVERMAHEIYHRMQPFGQVRITLFEEYSAYYLSMQISQTTWAQFKGYDARNPACLTRWFNDTNLMYAYQHLGLYPQSVISSVNLTSQACHLEGDPTEQTAVTTETITQTTVQSDITCQVNNEGTAICENTK